MNSVRSGMAVEILLACDPRNCQIKQLAGSMHVFVMCHDPVREISGMLTTKLRDVLKSEIHTYIQSHDGMGDTGRYGHTLDD